MKWYVRIFPKKCAPKLKLAKINYLPHQIAKSHLHKNLLATIKVCLRTILTNDAIFPLISAIRWITIALSSKVCTGLPPALPLINCTANSPKSECTPCVSVHSHACNDQNNNGSTEFIDMSCHPEEANGQKLLFAYICAYKQTPNTPPLAVLQLHTASPPITVADNANTRRYVHNCLRMHSCSMQLFNQGASDSLLISPNRI